MFPYVVDDITPFAGSVGARSTLNINRHVALEADAVWQSSGGSKVFSRDSGFEIVAQFDLKITRRMVADRPLGINLFAVVGTGLLNRRVSIIDPDPPPRTIRPAVEVRETVATFNFGGGVELVPGERLAIRVDLVGVLHPKEQRPYASPSSGLDSRYMLKLSSMFRF